MRRCSNTPSTLLSQLSSAIGFEGQFTLDDMQVCGLVNRDDVD